VYYVEYLVCGMWVVVRNLVGRCLSGSDRVKLCIQRSQSMTYFSSRAVFLSAGKVLDEVSSFPDYIYNIACLS